MLRLRSFDRAERQSDCKQTVAVCRDLVAHVGVHVLLVAGLIRWRRRGRRALPQHQPKGRMLAMDKEAAAGGFITESPSCAVSHNRRTRAKVARHGNNRALPIYLRLTMRPDSCRQFGSGVAMKLLFLPPQRRSWVSRAGAGAGAGGHAAVRRDNAEKTASYEQVLVPRARHRTESGGRIEVALKPVGGAASRPIAGMIEGRHRNRLDGAGLQPAAPRLGEELPMMFDSSISGTRALMSLYNDGLIRRLCERPCPRSLHAAALSNLHHRQEGPDGAGLGACASAPPASRFGRRSPSSRDPAWYPEPGDTPDNALSSDGLWLGLGTHQ